MNTRNKRQRANNNNNANLDELVQLPPPKKATPKKTTTKKADTDNDVVFVKTIKSANKASPKTAAKKAMPTTAKAAAKALLSKTTTKITTRGTAAKKATKTTAVKAPTKKAAKTTAVKAPTKKATKPVTKPATKAATKAKAKKPTKTTTKPAANEPTKSTAELIYDATRKNFLKQYDELLDNFFYPSQIEDHENVTEYLSLTSQIMDDLKKAPNQRKTVWVYADSSHISSPCVCLSDGIWVRIGQPVPKFIPKAKVGPTDLGVNAIIFASPTHPELSTSVHYYPLGSKFAHRFNVEAIDDENTEERPTGSITGERFGAALRKFIDNVNAIYKKDKLEEPEVFLVVNHSPIHNEKILDQIQDEYPKFDYYYSPKAAPELNFCKFIFAQIKALLQKMSRTARKDTWIDLIEPMVKEQVKENQVHTIPFIHYYAKKFKENYFDAIETRKQFNPNLRNPTAHETITRKKITAEMVKEAMKM